MKLFSSDLVTYLDKLVPDRPAVLLEMEKRAAEEGFPIIGPASGQACYMLARLANSQQIFELGSGFGYSTAWFAKAVKENEGGKVHHTIWEQSLSDEAKVNLSTLGYESLVEYHVGEALGLLKESAGALDLIFCDIDKEAYPEAVKISAEKLRPGGLFIIDNMLWSGQVFDEMDKSPTTMAIREASQLLSDERNWISSLLPIRDGLIAAIRK